MANFSTLFPNLQLDLDYSGDGTTANATDVAISTWARGGNTAELPLAKIPSIPISKISDFSFGEVHTIMLTDAQTSATDGTPSLAEIATFLSGNAQTPVAIHEGDVVVATGTESGGTTGDGVTITVLYTNGTSKDSGTDTFAASDLHQIASGATGIQTIAEGVGIDISGSNNTIALDLSELPDNTAALTSADELVILDGGTQGRKAASEIDLSIFSNAGSGFTTNTGTVTGATSGNTNTITVSTSSTSPVITAVTAAIADGGTGLATADQIFDHVTTRIAGLTSNVGTLTGIDAGTNIRIDDGATATPEVNLADDVDIVGTLDVSGVATFDSNVTLGAFGISEALATLVGFSANATNFNVNASSSSTLAAPSWNINSQSYDGNTTGSSLSVGAANFSFSSADAGSGSISAGTSGLDISSTSTDADGIDINSSGGIEIDAVGEIRLAGNGIATAASDTTPQALVIGDNGHVMSQAFPSTAPGAYNTISGSGTVGVTSTDFNKVIFLTGTAARIVNLSDGTTAGQWVKIFNDGAGTTDTIINGTIVGGNLTIDDSTANFEMIWDGTVWRILTA